MSRLSASQRTPKAVFVPPSRMEWTDEKLAGLDNDQLKSLLENLVKQREAGRVSEEIAADLTTRITARLPAGALTVRRKRSRSIVLLDARVAQALGDLALLMSRRYDLSEATARELSAGTSGFRPQPLVNKQGQAKAGASMKNGKMAIDRFVAYRVRDSLAALAYRLEVDQPQQTGRYVLLGTDDLLASGAPLSEVLPDSAGDYGWSRDSRARMRAQVATDFAQAQQLYEELIARVATKLPEE